MRPRARSAKETSIERYRLPMPWGINDAARKAHTGSATIRTEDVNGSGYHWYRLGSFPLRSSHYVWFFWSWIIQFDVGSAADPSEPDRAFDVWARIRFEGPGFPHGRAGDKDAISVERVVLVKADAAAQRKSPSLKE